jgi:hypothetical protein
LWLATEALPCEASVSFYLRMSEVNANEIMANNDLKGAKLLKLKDLSYAFDYKAKPAR